MKESMDKQVAYLEYTNRENNFHHHGYSEDMMQFVYLKDGDLRSVEQTKKLMESGSAGHLSDNPVTNMLYLNICHITLCTRFAVEGGMNPEKAYNASDLFIRRGDKLKTYEEHAALRLEVTEYFTKQVATVKKAHVFSKQVVQCMDYIQYHLHEAILVTELADMVGLNESYLSVLFKREVGKNITEYVMDRRMEAAENMLSLSDFSVAEISDILHFSSYSHFARVFKKYYNDSPKRYRNAHYQTTIMRNKSL